MAQLSGEYVGGGNAVLAWVTEPGPPQERWCLYQEAAEPGTVPGACLHGGVQPQPDAPECVLAPVAASAAEKIQIIWCFLTRWKIISLMRKSFGVSSRSRLRAQTSVTGLNVDHPSCTSLNKVRLAINLGTLSHTKELLAAVLEAPCMCGVQKKAEKGEVFEESLCYRMLPLLTFGKIFSKGLEGGTYFKNWSPVISCDRKGWHRKRKSVGISRAVSISD